MYFCTEKCQIIFDTSSMSVWYTWHFNDVSASAATSHNDVIILMSVWCYDVIESQENESLMSGKWSTYPPGVGAD